MSNSNVTAIQTEPGS